MEDVLPVRYPDTQKHPEAEEGEEKLLSLLVKIPAVRDSDFTDNKRDTNAIKRQNLNKRNEEASLLLIQKGRLTFWPIETN